MRNPFEETFSYTPFGFDVEKYVDRYWESIEKDEEELEEFKTEIEVVEEEPGEIIEGEVIGPEVDKKLEFDPILVDQPFSGDTFVAPVPLVHLEYNFQLGDTFEVESKNPAVKEIIFGGAKTDFSLFEPLNFDVINIGDVYKVVERNVDVRGRPYDYNITFERIRRGEINV